MPLADPRIEIKSNGVFRTVVCIALAGLVALNPQMVRAECDDAARKEIRDMNKKAMEAYQNMEFTSTKRILSHAFKLGDSKGCTLDWIHAYTLMNLAVLSIGGLNKKKLGIRFLTMALKIRPEAPLDKSVANPALTKIYEKVRNKLRITEEAKPWPTFEEKKPKPRGAPGEKPPELPLDHETVDEAPRGKPLTVKCRIKEDINPHKVTLYYRPPRQSSFSAVSMDKVPNTKWTWACVIPGKALWASTLQYYIVAKDAEDKMLAASGSVINPHIISVTSAGGLPESESPFKIKKKVKKKRKSGPAKFWIQVGPMFGVGLARGQVEVIDENGGISVDTGVPYDKIETPGFAPGSLGAKVEFGYRPVKKLPKLLLSVQARFGYIGMMTKNVPGAAIADFGGSVRARYFIFKFAKDWLEFYAGGGLGFAMIRHAVSLDLAQGSFVDTDLSMGITPSGFAGLVIGKGKTVRGYVETGFLMTVWGDPDLFTFHLDFSAGVAFAF